MPSPRHATVGLLLVLVASAARAEEPPVPLRQLCVHAPAVVLGTPVDPASPTRFRVEAVLRGTGLHLGEILTPAGIDPDQVRGLDGPDVARGKPRPRRIAHALLFLQPEDSGPGWRLLPGGMRFCTEDGRYLAPEDQQGKLTPQPGIRWAVVVARVRQDLAAVDQLNTYRRIGRPSRRAEALLGWVRQRQGEFAATSPGTDESPAGWGQLQMDVFDWIFAGTAPADAWPAVRLFAELNRGEAPQLTSPTFATPAGRALLAGIATDAHRLLGERTRALQLLSQPLTLHPGAAGRLHGAVALDDQERTALLETLLPQLAEKHEPFRVALTRVVASLSPSGHPVSGRSFEALVQTYRASPPGPARDELALTVCALAPPGRWKQLTGNPDGVCACLRDLQRVDSTIIFWLSLRTHGPAVFERPEVVLERLGTLGFVAETRRLPLEPQNLDRPWSSGWNGDDALVVRLATGKLTAGSTYKIRVEGFVGRGKDRQKWTSEPRKFQVPNNGSARQQQRSLFGGIR